MLLALRSSKVRIAIAHAVPSYAHLGTSTQETVFSRNNLFPGKVTSAMFSVY